MRKIFLIWLIAFPVIGFAQHVKNNWNYDIKWSAPTTVVDSIAYLQVELKDVWNHDSVLALWLSISNSSGNLVWEDSLSIPASCFSAQGSTCLIPVDAVKSGFYRYKARLIYRNQADTYAKIIDKTIQSSN